MPVIDVHAHMLSQGYLDLLLDKGAPQYVLRERPNGLGVVLEDGAPLLPMTPPMFDYKARVKGMDDAGVDVAVVSLTCPSAFFGGPEVSAKAATLINDDMRAGQTAYPDRIRFLATLPWQYPDLAVKELARACAQGAVGAVTLSNIHGRPLTDPSFAPIWQAIDERALPVFIHPTNPPGHREMGLGEYQLYASVAFVSDTTLTIARMVMDGFFDRFPRIKIISAHGGGTIPYVASRIEAMAQAFPAVREKIAAPPMHYLKQIYYDSLVFDATTLRFLVDFAGPSQVMYGTDYPHAIGDMRAGLTRINDLPPAQRKAVAGRSAQALFGL